MNNNGYPPNLWQEQETEENNFKSLCIKSSFMYTVHIKKLGNCYISALFQKRVFTESSKCQALLF